MNPLSKSYVLDDENRPVPATSIEEWGAFFENTNRRRVGYDRVGGFEVSTVFIGIDHRFFGEGPPILFETMVFPIDKSGEVECHRYSSWDDALTGHQATVRRLKEREATVRSLEDRVCGRLSDD
jgi:hypothetical protein